MRLQRSSFSIPLKFFVCLAACALLFAGCSALSSDTKIGEGVVNTNTLKLRSSTAEVALDIAQLKKGDRLDILEQMEIRTPTRIVEWDKVRTKTADAKTGWVEARYIVGQSIITKTEQLYQNSKSVSSQGRGRLKVQTKLRVEPAGDVATYLSKGTVVEIIGKARTTFKPEKQQSGDDTDEDEEEPETKTVLWCEVRLPDTDVIRAGWVGAQQVDLDVPDDIVYLEGEGRRFTGWVVFDQTRDKKGNLHDNYIGLMKSLDTEGPIDFTRIWVLTYSPDDGRYFGSFIKDGFRGVLPITLSGSGSRREFSFNQLDGEGKTVKTDFELVRSDASHVRVTQLTTNVNTKRRGR